MGRLAPGEREVRMAVTVAAGPQVPARAGASGQEQREAPARARGRSLAASTAPALLCVAWALDSPVLLLLALVLATWTLLHRWLPADVAVPASVLVLVGAATLAGVAAAALDVDLVERSGPLLAVYLAYCLVVTVLVPRGAANRLLPMPYGRTSLLAYAPAGLVACLALRSAVDERLSASWILLGTDGVRHMAFVHSLRGAGSLDYAANSYPQGLHMLAALVSVPGRALEQPQSAVVYELQLMAALSLLALALVVATAACTALRAAQAWGCSLRLGVGAALTTGLLLLWLSSYIEAFVFQAAAPSLLAAVVLWTLPLCALVLPPHRYRLVALLLIAAWCVMLLAHLWQALALAPVLATFALVVGRLRHPGQLVRDVFPGRAASLLLVCGVLLAVAVFRLPMLAVQASAGGIAVAAIPGKSPGPAGGLLVLAVAVIAVLAARGRGEGLRVLLPVQALALLLVCGLMLRANGRGWDLTQYYPQKVLWFFSILLLPLVVLVAARLVAALTASASRLLARLGPAARVGRAAAAAVVGALLFAFVVPLFVLETPALVHTATGGPRAEDVVRRLDLALEHGDRHGTLVPVPVSLGSRPLPDLVATPVVATLLSLQTGQPENRGLPQDVCSDVAHVAGDRPAVVVTALEPDYLRRLMVRRGCGDVPIVQVPGGGTDPFFLPEE